MGSLDNSQVSTPAPLSDAAGSRQNPNRPPFSARKCSFAFELPVEILMQMTPLRLTVVLMRQKRPASDTPQGGIVFILRSEREVRRPDKQCTPQRKPATPQSPSSPLGVELPLVLVAQSCPTLQPCGLQPARLLCPWNSPAKNTGVGCHAPPSPGDLPNPGIEARFSALQAVSLPSEHRKITLRKL